MRDLGIRPGKALILDLDQEIVLTSIIRDIILENGISCLAYNICGDHAHLVLVCHSGELSQIVKTIKGKSSFVFNKYRRASEIGNVSRLWSTKFYHGDLDKWTLSNISNRVGWVYNDTHLGNAINYIITNRIKHNLPKSSELEMLIEEFVISVEEAFGIL